MTAPNATPESTVQVARGARSTRRRRIAMELLLPPLVATLLVALSAVLGLVSGAGIVGFDRSSGAFDGLDVLGGATGAIVGLLVRIGARRADRASSARDAGPAPDTSLSTRP